MASNSVTDYDSVNLSNVVLQRLENLCMKSELSDVKLVVENEEIPAHKVILMSSSKYFEALFSGGFAESRQTEIELKVPLDAFEIILRFIYTGCVSLAPLAVSQIVEVCGLAELYSFTALTKAISKYLAKILSMDNCVEILNAACLFSLSNLQNTCLTFIDHCSAELIKHATFNAISFASLAILLKRDTFYAPEIDIYVAVRNWSINNPETDLKPLLSLIRCSLINMDELMNIVAPSYCLDPIQLMNIMKNSESKTPRIPCSSVAQSGENIASEKYNAKTIQGENAEALLDGNFTDYDSSNGYTYCTLGESYDSQAIVVKLGKVCVINYIEMLLLDNDARSFSYYIDVSLDGTAYDRLIDCTAYYYRSWQFLRFSSCPLQFIKIVGTRKINCTQNVQRNTVHGSLQSSSLFEIVGLKAMYIEGQVANVGFPEPIRNVAMPKIVQWLLKEWVGTTC